MNVKFLDGSVFKKPNVGFPHITNLSFNCTTVCLVREQSKSVAG